MSGNWHDREAQDLAALDYAEAALGEAYDILRRIAKGNEDPRTVAADFLEAHGFRRVATSAYNVPRELIQGVHPESNP